MPKQARSALTRAAIIRGAAEVFDRFGYGGTSLTDVITQAGVTKGALHFHFGTKEELAMAVVEEQHAIAMASAGRMAEQGHPALESVIRLSHELAGQLISEPVVRAGIRLTLENGTFRAPAPEPYQEWTAVVEQLLEKAVEEKDVRAVMPAADIARFVVSAFTGVQVVSQVLTERVDLHWRVRQMWDLLLPTLTPPKKVPYFRGVAAAGHLARGGDNLSGPPA
ncbi:ScbR family autoregulator-binding transcription factor [Actinokineospora bangkokensis]|uniref:HTH tetR-type domain-containing protein n=1 Tax=Actinokineospora bangkokensis TaxID=1193682 RepID=A0A1Q9LL10_9PSEU|nr:ScbR family autoregulator-binding transcription factor [Actinokineospora bangkokensis]OLR92685.1 hypothetical protein BJP25_21925 [Actinokineospora bangkokensis]